MKGTVEKIKETRITKDNKFSLTTTIPCSSSLYILFFSNCYYVNIFIFFLFSKNVNTIFQLLRDDDVPLATFEHLLVRALSNTLAWTWNSLTHTCLLNSGRCLETFRFNEILIRNGRWLFFIHILSTHIRMLEIGKTCCYHEHMRIFCYKMCFAVGITFAIWSGVLPMRSTGVKGSGMGVARISCPISFEWLGWISFSFLF